MKRRILCLLVAVMIFVTSVSARTVITSPTGIKAADYTDRPLLEKRLNEIFNGNCGLYTDNNCTSLAHLPLGSRLSNSAYYINSLLFGKQCYIYANAVYNKLFGEPVRRASGLKNSVVVMTGGNTVSYQRFTEAGIRIGAYMRTTDLADGSYNGYEGHSLIILGYDADCIAYLEGNADNNGLIRVSIESWGEFNQRKLSGRGRYVCHVVQPTDTYFELTYGKGLVSCSKNHNASEWQTTKMPTASASGQRVLVCTKCNEKITTQTVKYGDLAKNFEDLQEKDWFYESVSFVYYKGLFKGLDELHFGPNNNMTRAMFVTVLGRLEGVPQNYQGMSTFNDVKRSQYYAPYVAWACDRGIVSGMGDGKFAPNQNVTREQICKMMYRYCQIKQIELPDGKDDDLFLDDADISAWAKDFVYACRAGGIINGEPKKKGYVFLAKQGATRAQVATILYNFTGQYIPANSQETWSEFDTVPAQEY